MSTLFQAKKKRILKQLDVPDDTYTDLSPKGSVDEGIRDLLADINSISSLVSTSSCAGRISVFQEGAKKQQNQNGSHSKSATAGPGGKGGGRWLFISHDSLQNSGCDLLDLFGLTPWPAENEVKSLDSSTQYIHFKFEAMILHVLTESIDDAARVLTAASAAGFRESGAMSLTPNADGQISPMVAIRTNGLAMDSIIGHVAADGTSLAIVTKEHLQLLVDIANDRFAVNTQRIERFRKALQGAYAHTQPTKDTYEERRARKRAEGLARQQGAQKAKLPVSHQPMDFSEENSGPLFEA